MQQKAGAAMNKLKYYSGRIGVKLGIPEEIAMDEARVVLIGSSRIQLLNHKGIVEYSDECIRLRTDQGMLRIEGSTLRIDEYTAQEICISGTIKQIMLL